MPHTDGVTEARDADRAFCPLAESLARHLYNDPARPVAALHEELLSHAGGRLHEDAALLLLREPATPGSAAPAPAATAGPASFLGTGSVDRRNAA
ncbi:SpoIIE family protein phosphatase [Streptomyces sp. NPDC050388]|uniref:SpoIIE family protein phosphatase n=1 Tax=Streptomyces sp. NPDC050388 TaxID=3155781 RepID=UPI003434B643